MYTIAVKTEGRWVDGGEWFETLADVRDALKTRMYGSRMLSECECRVLRVTTLDVTTCAVGEWV